MKSEAKEGCPLSSFGKNITAPMNIKEIERLVERGESATLELKQSTGELHKGMETACAFLNSDGGWLLFGVTPGMKIIGQEVTDRTRQE